MPDDKIRSADDVRYRREMLEYEVHDFLRSRGWRYTSSTPGCIWLWERKLDDGRIVLVSTDAAVHMQGWFDMKEGEDRV